jgi:hypothetical protein
MSETGPRYRTPAEGPGARAGFPCSGSVAGGHQHAGRNARGALPNPCAAGRRDHAQVSVGYELGPRRLPWLRTRRAQRPRQQLVPGAAVDRL